MDIYEITLDFYLKVCYNNGVIEKHEKFLQRRFTHLSEYNKAFAKPL